MQADPERKSARFCNDLSVDGKCNRNTAIFQTIPKVRYRGLDKNAHSVFTKCALANLVLAKKHLLAA